MNLSKISGFINKGIIKRGKNFFLEDIKSNFDKFSSQIENKKVLLIGGAGTIGSNYLKSMLHFKPAKIVVVDINENGLTELTRDLRSSKALDYNPEYITYPVSLISKTFEKIFWSDKFDLVANFSAHKHVRSEKDIISVEACYLLQLVFVANINK